jgi:hypothetical protein
MLLDMNKEPIDFENDEEVKKLASDTVEIPVGVLNILLGYYYTGGGEPFSKNDRLNQAYQIAVNQFK